MPLSNPLPIPRAIPCRSPFRQSRRRALALLIHVGLVWAIAVVGLAIASPAVAQTPVVVATESSDQPTIQLNANVAQGNSSSTTPASASTFASPVAVTGNPAAPPIVNPAASPAAQAANLLQAGPQAWTSPQGLTSALQVMLLLTVLSMAPAILLMTTCFVRILVVLGLLRQAIGAQQLPPSQVITSLAIFMTIFIMAPVWQEVYQNAVVPYTAPGGNVSLAQAWETGLKPIHRFMSRQVELAGNSDDVWLFYRYWQGSGKAPETYDEVPIAVLLPAFMLSELKVAFVMGVQIYLPFLILDMVIASITVSMGMVMLPPAMISLPFKLLLFILVDGWRLVVGMLLESFVPGTGSA